MEHAHGLGIVGQVIGHHLTGGEDFFQRTFLDAQLRSLFIRQERIEDFYRQLVVFQHVDDHFADHAGTDNADIGTVITGIVSGDFSGPGHITPAHPDGILVETLVCKNDLGHGVLCHRHAVGCPGAAYLHTTVQEGSCKALHRTCTIKHVFQIGECIPDFLFRKGRHTPGRENVIHIPECSRIRHHIIPVIEGLIQICNLIEFFQRFRRIDISGILRLITQ